MTDEDDDPEIEEILSKALADAKKAFWKSLEDGGWDIPIRYVFAASELSTEDYRTTLHTVRIDNAEVGPDAEV